MQDRVPQTRIYRAWTGPNWGTPDAHHLALAAAVLAGDKNSRLYQRLVYRDRLASDVSLDTVPLEIAGVTYLVVSAQPGADLAAIDRAVNEELGLFMRKGPSRKELQRVTTQLRAGFLRGVEKVGGFRGKAGILTESMVLGGSPDYYKKKLDSLNTTRPEDLRLVTAAWLGQGSYTITVLPYPELKAAAAGADRSSLPKPGAEPAVGFPPIQRSELGNGLRIMLAPRPGIGFVVLQLIVDGGYAADSAGIPGTAKIAMAMLDEGTATRSSLQISEQLSLLGADLDTGASLDTANVSLNALRDKLEPSLSIFADVVLNPAFPPEELERLRGVYLSALQQEKNRPNSMAMRVLPKLLYGPGHPYALPLTGTGTEASIKALTREQLAAFHATWFKPNHATLVVAGDTTMAKLQPIVERLFARWQPGDTLPLALGAAQSARQDVLYLLDRPGADQSVIFAGQTMPPRSNPDEFAIQMMNDVLGGQASARINMNLREDKHWSYGAYSMLVNARGERPFFAYAPVQTDKTAEALQELRSEIKAITGARPITAAELEHVKTTEVLSLPGRWETAGAVAGALAESVKFGLSDDYWPRYAAQVNAVALPEVDRAAHSFIRPEQQIWVVVGDRAKIEPGLSKLGFAEIRAINADGEAL